LYYDALHANDVFRCPKRGCLRLAPAQEGHQRGT
jgi:hypothetical protein